MLPTPLLNRRKIVYRSTLDFTTWEFLHAFNDRLRMYAKNGRLAFDDTCWPSLLVYDDPGIRNFNAKLLVRLFYWGYCPAVTEFIPQQFAFQKHFSSHKNFWQYPCRTEQDAYERHLELEEPVFGKRTAHTYIGLPWATWIDKKDMPVELIKHYGERLESIRLFLANKGVALHAHTVCQHVDWKLKKYIKCFELAGINHLWIAHKEKGWDKVRRIRLHSWPLYAVNALDQNRKLGLEVVPVEEKTIFASFKGAHMANYPSDIRLRLKQLVHKTGYNIEVNDRWHFSDIVYDYQVGNRKQKDEQIESKETLEYNKLLSQSLFSLCPRGSGPNTLRLWESLAIGSIPVVLSDQYEFPSLAHMGCGTASWSEAVIEIKESDLDYLDDYLSALTQTQCQRLQRNGIHLFAKIRNYKCFG